MAKHVQPKVVTYTCDRCGLDVPGGAFDVDVKYNVKDNTVEVHKGETLQICELCRHLLSLWWVSV